jgi:hypothetical protein
MTVNSRLQPDGGSTLRHAGDLVGLLPMLCRRPRRGELPGRHAHDLPRGRYGLPLVCVVRPPGSPVLRTLAGQLATARPGQLPHALVSCEPSPRPPIQTADRDAQGWPATGQVADLLSQLARSLGGTRNSRFGRIRFSRFGLTSWLLRQDVRGDDVEPDQLLLRRLRERAVAGHRFRLTSDQFVSASPSPVPGWARLLIAVVPPLWFLMRIGGRVPGLTQPYRWLLRQPYLAPRDPGTFIGFAERLTVGGRAEEDPEQVRKLLVNAFLEDLRAAYRRRPWRPRGARRTTYPVALLDEATSDNGGFRLLKLINDVRSETGSFDPLLLISGSPQLPPAVDPVTAAATEFAWPAARASEGYQAWCRQFAADSRSRKPTAWYLAVRVEPDEATVEPGADRRDPVVLPRLVAPDPPLWARRGVLLVAIVLAAAGVTGCLVPLYQARARADASWAADHCGQSRGGVFADQLHTDPTGRCYGISDGTMTFSADPDVHDTLRTIHNQNLVLKSGRPTFTVVHFSALDSSSPTNSMLELAGIAAKQREYNADPTSRAQLRILVANGGVAMEQGRTTAAELGELARRDPTIVGVIGLSESRRLTQETIAALGQAGLPVVAATLSADTLIDQSPMYLQVSPQNSREADVAAHYLVNDLAPRRHLSHEVTIVASNDPDDIYSSNLRERIASAVSRLDPTFAVAPTQLYAADSLPGPPAEDVGRGLCQYPGAVFYAGRPDDFGRFLNGIRSKCLSTPPAILAGDDVSRYVAEPAKRARYGIDFQYLSFAVGKTSCNAAGLYANLREILPKVCQPGELDPSLDGHAALAYDAMYVMTHAIDSLLLDGTPPNPGTVWHQLTMTTGKGAIEGETGIIDFNGTPNGQYMADKAVAVMAVDSQGVVAQVGTCGRQVDQTSWCPAPVTP